MTPPVSTYRIQFRDGMTFDKAAENLSYLKQLGVSHVYASPVFTATSGSTHGYDVTDVNEIDPAIGGRAGFDRFVYRLKALGLGLILDIVPNHMAASGENAWWRDVLEKGRESAFSSYFDIDWSRRLTLPWLGKPFEAVAEAGELTIACTEDGKFEMRYFDAGCPLSEESASWLRAETGGNPGLLSAFARVPGNLASLHDRQHWQLIAWQEAARRLSYRRFFEVTGLVGLRVEDPEVFDAAHRLVLDLVRRGDVQGLRIDHVDGLADPAAYLQRLRAAVGEDIFIVVEKILGPGETLPETWPVAGTTGYEFMTALGHLFTSEPGLEILARHYRRLVPSLSDFDRELTRAKTEMATRNFEGEMERLTNLACDRLPLAQRSQVRDVLRALAAAFPVYRTYGTAAGLSAPDRMVLDTVVAKARTIAGENPAFEPVVGLFSDDRPGRAEEFLRRWQQLTGPIMAKSMEDTLFYRDNRFLAANEVGGEPDAAPGGVEAFHAAMLTRLRTQPNGLSATSTHDTKRGEDARARLYAISEDAEGWVENVARWRRMNAGFVTQLPTGPAPDSNTEWMLYQAMLGVLPESWESDLQALRSRFCAYALKAIREAKTRTDWNAPDEAYEEAVQRFAAELLSEENRSFLDDFVAASHPYVMTGHRNSLSQTAIKLVAPGIPDFYQGTEGFDYSLVDPDNRRMVDYGPLAAGLKNTAEPDDPLSWKLHLVRRGLEMRQARPELFAQGEYRPLTVTGSRAAHVAAFMRQHGNDYVAVVVPRLVLQSGADQLIVPATFWGDTTLELPSEACGRKRDILTGRSYIGDKLAVGDVLSQPVALLVS